MVPGSEDTTIELTFTIRQHLSTFLSLRKRWTRNITISLYPSLRLLCSLFVLLFKWTRSQNQFQDNGKKKGPSSPPSPLLNVFSKFFVLTRWLEFMTGLEWRSFTVSGKILASSFSNPLQLKCSKVKKSKKGIFSRRRIFHTFLRSLKAE